MSLTTTSSVGLSSNMNKVRRVIAVNLDREKKFEEAFRYFDHDDDGFVTIAELQQVQLIFFLLKSCL